ncbi:MAG: hypothetical protein A2066_04190 [Bacteroidetes bacterium GWB2_41_8]|nr:MAG: hypothetical protein A2066_04190 [Bacteroidetes bacterium GWB2_41_8]
MIIRGARQTGKSYTITEFGNKHFEGATHIINFEKRIDWHSVFDLNVDVTRKLIIWLKYKIKLFLLR